MALFQYTIQMYDGISYVNKPNLKLLDFLKFLIGIFAKYSSRMHPATYLKFTLNSH